MSLLTYSCQFCGHQWTARVAEPIRCPKCGRLRTTSSEIDNAAPKIVLKPQTTQRFVALAGGNADKLPQFFDELAYRLPMLLSDHPEIRQRLHEVTLDPEREIEALKTQWAQQVKYNAYSGEAYFTGIAVDDKDHRGYVYDVTRTVGKDGNSSVASIIILDDLTFIRSTQSMTLKDNPADPHKPFEVRTTDHKRVTRDEAGLDANKLLWIMQHVIGGITIERDNRGKINFIGLG